MFNFEKTPLALNGDLTRMAVEAWNGNRLDLAGVIEEEMRRVIWEKPGKPPENHEF